MVTQGDATRGRRPRSVSTGIRPKTGSVKRDLKQVHASVCMYSDSTMSAVSARTLRTPAAPCDYIVTVNILSLGTCATLQGELWDCAFSPDGLYLVGSTRSATNPAFPSVICYWKIGDGKLRCTVDCPYEIQKVLVDPGNTAYVCTLGTLGKVRSTSEWRLRAISVYVSTCWSFIAACAVSRRHSAAEYQESAEARASSVSNKHSARIEHWTCRLCPWTLSASAQTKPQTSTCSRGMSRLVFSLSFRNSWLCTRIGCQAQKNS